jgi:hypothetical protein
MESSRGIQAGICTGPAGNMHGFSFSDAHLALRLPVDNSVSKLITCPGRPEKAWLGQIGSI